jgi:hypothetical protein
LLPIAPDASCRQSSRDPSTAPPSKDAYHNWVPCRRTTGRAQHESVDLRTVGQCNLSERAFPN